MRRARTATAEQPNALASSGDQYRGRVEVVTVDTEDRPDLTRRYNVRSVPTLLVFKEGHVIAQQVGLGSARRVEALFADAAGDPGGGRQAP